MEIKKFSIHPLFFLFGVYYALIGKITVFFIYTITAVLHELGHSFIAEKLGYKLTKITLMPFGAVIFLDDCIINVKDELKIAFAGPLFNLFIAIFFVAFWWIFPETYAFTYIIVESNFALAIINFFPFFPLDGGRILFSMLSLNNKKEMAKNICKIVSLFGVLVLLSLFVFSLFYSVNISLLFFALFILFGVFSKDKENIYQRLTYSLNYKKLKRGVEYKRIAVDESTLVKDIVKNYNGEFLIEVVVFSNNKVIKTLSQQKIEKILLTANWNKPIICYLD